METLWFFRCLAENLWVRKRRHDNCRILDSERASTVKTGGSKEGILTRRKPSLLQTCLLEVGEPTIMPPFSIPPHTTVSFLCVHSTLSRLILEKTWQGLRAATESTVKQLPRVRF